jgi:hypothetical protein
VERAPAPVEIRLLAEPTRLTMAGRDRFRVGLVAVNTSDAAIDPGLFAARLLVDGEPSPAFDLALGSGVVPAGWDVLAAGAETPPVEYPLGEALFPAPGEYRLVLRLDVAGRPPVEASQTVVVGP